MTDALLALRPAFEDPSAQLAEVKSNADDRGEDKLPEDRAGSRFGVGLKGLSDEAKRQQDTCYQLGKWKHNYRYFIYRLDSDPTLAHGFKKKSAQTLKFRSRSVDYISERSRCLVKSH